MKKSVYFLLFALCFPLGMVAQSIDDDLYFVPSKEKQEEKEPQKKIKEEAKKTVTTNIYTAPGTTVVVQDRNGKKRDIDEYNRRYDARENDFVLENDTLYIKEKEEPDLDGEWVTGEFDGTQIMSMPNVLSVSAIRVLQSVLVVRCIGILFME